MEPNHERTGEQGDFQVITDKKIRRKHFEIRTVARGIHTTIYKGHIDNLAETYLANGLILTKIKEGISILVALNVKDVLENFDLLQRK